MKRRHPVAVTLLLLLLIPIAMAGSGCQSPEEARTSEQTARLFVESMFEGDDAAASRLASRRITGDELAAVRHYVTGDSRTRVVESVAVRLVEQGAAEELFEVVSVDASPCVDASVLNERDLTVSVVSRQGQLVVLLPPEPLSSK